MEESRKMPWDFHTCKLCPYRTNSTFVIFNHIRLHQTRSKTDTFLCDSKPIELFECKFCEFTTNLKVDLTDHIHVFHEGKEDNYKQDSILKCYLCNKNCAFETHSLLVLAKHVDVCEIAKRCKSRRSRSQTVRWHKCKLCTYQAKQSNNLKRHIRVKHTNPEDCFGCVQCTFKTKENSLMKRHIALKHDVNPKVIKWLKCEQCTFKTRSNSSLKRHVKIQHTNSEDINWFKCGQCPHKTKQKNNLKLHIIAMHTDPEDIKWVKCGQCNFKSADKVHFYKFHVHPNIEQVLQYYHQQNKIEITPLTLVGEVSNRPYFQHKYLQKQTIERRLQEVIPYNDCFYRYISQYKYVVFLDIDEVIVPTNNSWFELMETLQRNQSKKSSYLAKHVDFFDNLEIQSHKNIPNYMHMLRHINRKKYPNPTDYVKGFFDTDKVVAVYNNKTSNCKDWEKCENDSLEIEVSLAQLQHYGDDCVNTTTDDEGIEESVEDLRLWYLKDVLIGRVTKTLKDLDFLKKDMT